MAVIGRIVRTRRRLRGPVGTFAAHTTGTLVGFEPDGRARVRIGATLLVLAPSDLEVSRRKQPGWRALRASDREETPAPRPPSRPRLEPPVRPPPRPTAAPWITLCALGVAAALFGFTWIPSAPAARGGDQDCADIGHQVRVGPSDVHDLDRDGDGIGCEWDGKQYGWLGWVGLVAIGAGGWQTYRLQQG